MAQNIYSQSVDSLPLKELNNEFLKGIKARERVVSLKAIIHLDSQQLSLYKDTIVPNYKKALDTCKYEIVRLNGVIDQKDQAMKFYKYGFLTTSILFILKLIL